MGRPKEFDTQISIRVLHSLLDNLQKYANEKNTTIRSAARTILTSFFTNYYDSKRKDTDSE